VANSDDLVPLPSVGTRLIEEPGAQPNYTSNQETDARTALTRGLAEYVSQLSIDASGGRFLAFNAVFQTWAEPEDEAVYPRAAVYAESPGEYEDSKLTPIISSVPRLPPPDGRFITSPAEMRLDMILDVWTTDPAARYNLVALLEDRLNPVDWRYGMLLELPHYFGQQGTYEPRDMSYIDGEDSAQRRIRRARFTIRGRVAVTKLVSRPGAQVRTNADALETTLPSKKGVIFGIG
jgi:hypothetical protein